MWRRSGPRRVRCPDPDWSGGRVFVNRRERTVAVSPEALFAAVRRVGGTNGWYFANWLWRLLGFLDRLAGGPGLRRGRRDPEALAPGEAVDFWRVVAFEQGRLLRLHAEMKLPGEAELQFEVSSAGAGARLVQTARFRPRGLAGLVYWVSILPLHGLVFDWMADGICRAASRRSTG